jgi:hypothetical protein
VHGSVAGLSRCVFTIDSSMQRMAVVCVQNLGQSKQLIISCSDDNSLLIDIISVAHGSSLRLVNTNLSHVQSESTTDCNLLTSVSNGTLPLDATCEDFNPDNGFVVNQCSSAGNCTIDVAEMPEQMYSCQGNATDFLLITYTCLSSTC